MLESALEDFVDVGVFFVSACEASPRHLAHLRSRGDMVHMTRMIYTAAAPMRVPVLIVALLCSGRILLFISMDGARIIYR